MKKTHEVLNRLNKSRTYKTNKFDRKIKPHLYVINGFQFVNLISNIIKS